MIGALICLLLSVGVSVLIYQRYASFSTLPVYVPILTIFGWTCVLFIVFLVPLDVVHSTSGTICNSTSTPPPSMPCVPQSTLYVVLWSFLYWTSSILAWLVYPVVQGYVMGIEFSTVGNVRFALVSNAIYYALGTFMIGIVLLYVGIRADFNWGVVQGVAIALVNMWTLLFFLVFLGFGLVEVPRRCFRWANQRAWLDHILFQIGDYDRRLFQAKIAVNQSRTWVRKQYSTWAHDLGEDGWSKSNQTNQSDGEDLGKRVEELQVIDQKLQSFWKRQGMPRAILEEKSVSNENENGESLTSLDVPTHRDMVNMHWKVIDQIRDCVIYNELYKKYQVEALVLNDVLSQRQRDRKRAKKWISSRDGQFYPPGKLQSVAKKLGWLPFDRMRMRWNYFSFREENSSSSSSSSSRENPNHLNSSANHRDDFFDHPLDQVPPSYNTWVGKLLLGPRSWLVQYGPAFLTEALHIPRTGAILEYLWYIHLAPHVYFIVGVCCAVLSLLLLWSESLFSLSRDFSVPSLMIHAVAGKPFFTWVFTFVPVAYMAICASTAVFGFEIFSYYRLVPHQLSDGNSMLCSGAWLVRLILPLPFNYLLMVHSHGDSAFYDVVGEMSVVPLIGDRLNVYLPILLGVWVLFSVFGVWGRCVQACDRKQYYYERDFKDAFLQEGTNQHLKLVERRKAEKSSAMGVDLDSEYDSERDVDLGLVGSAELETRVASELNLRLSKGEL